jgi:putative ABC transport system permease protein
VLTPWRRAPLLLVRRPGVAAALAAAAFVAVLPAAAAPLFLSAAQNATLHRQVSTTCPSAVGVRISSLLALSPAPFLTPGSEVFRRRGEAAAAAAAPGLTTPVVSMISDANAEPVGRPSRAPNVRGLTLVGSNDYTGHLIAVEGPVGNGIWVPDQFAAAQGLRVGDQLRLSRRSQVAQRYEGLAEPTTYDVPVAAIYRDLRSLPDQPRWCSMRDLYRGRPGQEFTNEPVLPMALVDTGTFLAAGDAMQLRAIHAIEYALVDPGQPAPDAAALAARIGRMQTDLFTGENQDVLGTDFFNRTTFASGLDRMVRRADLVRSGLLPPVVPITAAGTAVGLAVVAAAAVFWVQRRRQELLVLSAHGVGARALGVKGVLEALPAVLVGGAAGWAAAWALVRWTGPSPILSADAVPRASVAAAATTLVALLLVGMVAAARCRGLADQPGTHTRHLGWGRLPWELLPLAAAPAAWVLLAEARTADVEGGVGDVAHIPARLLVVPILVIAGVVLLVGRLGARRLRRRGLARTPVRPAALLAWRRIVRDATTTAVLAGATAVPIAMAAYGAAVTDSIRTTADAEVRLLLGSDVVATLSQGAATATAPPAVPDLPTLAGRTTQVTRLNAQHLGDLTVDVLVVDPATFASGAYWDDRMPGPTLADAMGLLRPGPVPAVVASSTVATGDATLNLLGELVPVEVVSARLLPGEQAGYPLVLMHRDAVPAAARDGGRQLWVRGNPVDVQDTMVAAKVPLARLVTADDLQVGALHEPVTFTFQYLIALSVFTGLIAVVGLLLYLESRTATHRRAYVLLRRLGLRAGAHRRALLVELGGPVLLGLVVGLGLAAGLASGLAAYFDIESSQPPGAILVLPYPLAGVVAATALVVATGAALLAHRRISRANPAEVLRDVA